MTQFWPGSTESQENHDGCTFSKYVKMESGKKKIKEKVIMNWKTLLIKKGLSHATKAL